MLIIRHSDFMEMALEQARLALGLGEVPVGAVVVRGNEVVATGYNRRETDKSALGHAEIMAVGAACENLKSWRLSGCRIYVTLEPCPMCMGAIINSRLDAVIFGALDTKAGCCGSVVDLNSLGFNHNIEILGGINELKCQKMLSDFFEILR